MHSRIFQITEAELSPLDYIDSLYLNDSWFTGEIADYVADSNREQDIQLLREFLAGIAEIDDSGKIAFSPDALESYLMLRYQRFQKYVEEMRTYTYDDFRLERVSPGLYNLESLVNDTFGYYMVSEDDEIQTFDEWIRWHDLTKPYYIGATLDYHF